MEDTPPTPPTPEAYPAFAPGTIQSAWVASLFPISAVVLVLLGLALK